MMNNSDSVRCKSEFEKWVVKDEIEGDDPVRCFPPNAQNGRKRDFACLSDDEDSRRPNKLSIRTDLQDSEDSSGSDYESDRAVHPNLSSGSNDLRSSVIAENFQRYMELVTRMARIQELQHGSVMPWPWVIPSMPRMYQVPGMLAPYLMYPNALSGTGLPWLQNTTNRPAMPTERENTRMTSPPSKVRRRDRTDTESFSHVQQTALRTKSPDMSRTKTNAKEESRSFPHVQQTALRTELPELSRPQTNAKEESRSRQSQEGIRNYPQERVHSKSKENTKRILESLAPIAPKYKGLEAPSVSPEAPVERNYECGQCKMRTRSHHGLKRHLHSHGTHLPTRPAVCAKCRQQFLNVFDLYFHVLSHEKGDSNNNSDPEETQELPNAAEEGEEPVSDSVAKKLFPRYFECGECGLRVRSHYGLRRHFSKHTSIGALPAVCSLCRVSFANTVQLQGHIMSHPEAASNLMNKRPGY